MNQKMPIDYYSEKTLCGSDDRALFYEMKENGIHFRTDDAAVLLYARHACSFLLRKALEAGANPNATDENGKTALTQTLSHSKHPWRCAVRLIQNGANFEPGLLIHAVRSRKREPVTALLAAGAPVNVQDEHGNTALHYAARMNAEFLIRELISAGAAIDIPNGENYTPLLLSVRHRCYKAARFLLENGANPYFSGGKHHLNAYQLSERYQCELRDNTPKRLPWDETARKNLVPYRFYCAALAGNEAQVRRLVNQGLDINAYDSFGYTALHRFSEHQGNIGILIRNGADMYAETQEGTEASTAPAIAAAWSMREHLETFLNNGYKLNHIDSSGKTLLMHCAAYEWEWGARELLTRGADPSIKDADGQTALFYVCDEHNICYDEIIDLLLEHGADVNVTDNKGNTALLQIADREIEGDGTHLKLIQRGINVNHRNHAGQTALSIAIQHGHSHLIKELKAAGATAESAEKDSA